MRNFYNLLSVVTSQQVEVQTDSVTIFNTESLRNISEPAIQSAPGVQEVQTKSLCKFLKKTKCLNKILKKTICMDSSDIEGNTMNNLDPSQNIPANANEVLGKVFDIMDDLNFGLAFSQPNAIFDHLFTNGIHEYFIKYSDIILSVNPDLISTYI
jgi:hypothetical protein